MKILKIISIYFCCLLCVCNSVFAQKKNKNFSGEIIYTLTYNNLPTELSAFSSLLPSQLTIYIKDSTFLIQTLIGEQSIKIIKKIGDNNIMLLFNMTGITIATELSSNDSNIITNKIKDWSFTHQDSSFTFEKNTETKTICGYTCQGYDIYKSDDEGKHQLATLFTCPNFIAWPKEGLPFYIKTNDDNEQSMSITMEISKIKHIKLSNDIFSIPQNAIRMTISDLLNSIGGND